MDLTRRLHVAGRLLRRRGRRFVAADQELASQDQQPYPKRQPQRPAGDSNTQQRPGNCAKDASNNQLRQQLGARPLRNRTKGATSMRP